MEDPRTTGDEVNNSDADLSRDGTIRGEPTDPVSPSKSDLQRLASLAEMSKKWFTTGELVQYPDKVPVVCQVLRRLQIIS